MHGPGDGFSYGNLNVWHRNAFVYEKISFDQCLGHADVMGNYHNHVSGLFIFRLFKYLFWNIFISKVIATCLVLNVSTTHSFIVGYAFDWYPVYGPYGYSDPLSSSSPIRRMVTGYSARTMAVRNTLTNDTILTSQYYEPTVDSTYPSGSFIEDYAWLASNGDSDACMDAGV
jgi:hypothetical protein